MRCRPPPGRSLRRVGRLALVAAVALFVPAPQVHPTTISLTSVTSAKAVDVGDPVLWVLVLGSDARPGQDVTSGLTDAIQLVGVDWRAGRAVTVGIPRDGWVQLPGGAARINTALAEGGTELAAEKVAELVGIPPDLVLVVGFEGFLSAVAALGTVSIDSPQEFVTEDGGRRVRRGRTVLDARAALDVARTRRGLVGDDFARSANHQRLMLGALATLREREDEEGFIEAVALATAAGLETDLSLQEVYRFAQAVTQVQPSRVQACVLGGRAAVVSGASVVLLDEEQARALGRDVGQDVRLDGGCRDGS